MSSQVNYICLVLFGTDLGTKQLYRVNDIQTKYKLKIKSYKNKIKIKSESSKHVLGSISR